MNFMVAAGAECDQIFPDVVSEPASGMDVVDLEVGTTLAGLAAPTIPLQHVLAQLTIGLWVEPEA